MGLSLPSKAAIISRIEGGGLDCGQMAKKGLRLIARIFTGACPIAQEAAMKGKQVLAYRFSQKIAPFSTDAKDTQSK